MTITHRQVSAGTVADAIQQWQEVLGADHVLTSSDDLEEYRDPYAIPKTDRRAQAVLQPGSVEDIQAVLRIANETGVPVWTTSQGRNNGYGGGAPVLNGGIIMNLRRMNRVLEINEELAYVVVEPGVSYFDLYQAVKDSGKRLVIDVPDIGWGSIIGNALEYGNGYTNYGDHASAVAGMEVVLANGDIVRTGMGAMPESPSWHLNKRGFGPSVDGLFMQSNLGIVTKMGVWVMPQPDTYMDCWVTVAREEDLEALVDTFRPFLVDGTVSNCPTLFNPLAPLAMQVPRTAVWDREGHIPHEAAAQMGAQHGLGPWNIRFALYGDPVIVERNLERIREAFQQIPGSEVRGQVLDIDEIEPGDESTDQKQKVQAGVPDLSMLRILEYDGGDDGGHLSFAATVPLTGTHVRKTVDLTRARQEDAGLDYHAGIILYQRFAIHISLLLYSLKNQERATKIHEVYESLVKEAAQMGYGEYRTHPEFMDLVADQYDFNNKSLLRFVESLKNAADPRGILAPGKQGIWPARDTSPQG